MTISIVGTYSNLTVHRGDKISGMVPILGLANTNDTKIPITIIHNPYNDNPHPTLLLLSGIHGSEYTPILTSQTLAHTLTPNDLTVGSIVFVHVANLRAFVSRTIYNSPIDHQNLNRVFPGKQNGTITEQLAYFITTQLYPLADCVVDLHSGDANERLAPTYTAYYGKAGSLATIQKSRDMAMAFGSSLVVEFQWELDSPGAAIWSTAASVAMGIPSMDVELAPGRGRSHDELAQASINATVRGMMRVLRHWNITSDDAIIDSVSQDCSLPPPCLVSDRRFVESPVTGSWTPLVDTETYVTKGTTLGRVVDLFGQEELWLAEAPADGLMIIRFDTPPVNIRDTVAVVAVLNETDLSCRALLTIHNASTPSEEAPAPLWAWQWLAALGWLVAIGLGVANRVRYSNRKHHCYELSPTTQQSHPHNGEPSSRPGVV